MTELNSLRGVAIAVRARAYAPYSNFYVGAALKTSANSIFAGCNVENAAYPEGTCAEAGAIAAMVAAGQREITEAYVVADCQTPLPPCGGCRQKLAQFAAPEARIFMATLHGEEKEMRIEDLLPGACNSSFMERDQ